MSFVGTEIVVDAGGLSAIITAEIEEVKRGVKAGIKRAMTTVRRKGDEWVQLHFAEELGNLIGSTAITPLFASEPFELVLTTGVPYVKFVNLFNTPGHRKVKFTKTTTTPNFFDVLKEKLGEWLEEELKKELVKIKTIHVEVTVGETEEYSVIG